MIVYPNNKRNAHTLIPLFEHVQRGSKNDVPMECYQEVSERSAFSRKRVCRQALRIFVEKALQKKQTRSNVRSPELNKNKSIGI